MADWSLPTVSGTTYVNWNTQLKDRDLDVFKGGDPAVVTVTNIPTNAIRWNSASNKWEKFNGASWADLSALYAIAVSGNSGTATKWATARSLTLTGAVTGVQSFDGSANASLATSYSTVPVASGGTNIVSYAIGDLLYASGATTLSKLADVATGNVLISGGVGAAPSWGQVGLTTHVTGVLPLANGGTNANSAVNARTQLGVVIGTDVQAFNTLLNNIAGLGSNGLIIKNGTSALARSIAGEANRIVVSNADGTAGNPTLTIGTQISKQKTGTLTDAASITWDYVTNGNIVQVTLGGNRTLANMTNAEAGSSGFLDVIQDATGGRTLAFSSNYRFIAGVDPVVTSTTLARDRLYWSTFDGTIIDITQTVDMKT